MIWALILIVTVKYVVFLMRADNKGEGGTLALMALAQRVVGRALRLGLHARHGRRGAVLRRRHHHARRSRCCRRSRACATRRASAHAFAPLRAADRGRHPDRPVPGAGRAAPPRGRASSGRSCALWFLVLAGLGVYHIADDLVDLPGAVSPTTASIFLIDNGFLGFIILGSVFLAVTGAEALYADMGHFGKNPIRAAWLVFVFPCLLLNYLGQGALVLHHPARPAQSVLRDDPAGRLLAGAAPGHRRHGHRQPGGDHRRLLA